MQRHYSILVRTRGGVEQELCTVNRNPDRIACAVWQSKAHARGYRQVRIRNNITGACRLVHEPEPPPKSKRQADPNQMCMETNGGGGQ
jgi:hypothetical protein